ncbi:hypothetical protein CBR_g29549 [Chara braunii]|uniref:Uncharacterized protein n=1 Tax=Chara braunii TaxID=69332 RepID=A0A388LAR5_CHABU|nr:hypothetical protein CBR_g29549 [Chara braunii]|eukprot:GBG79401.1 hypothetical protein CBR_g29549 [Chara braunii]
MTSTAFGSTLAGAAAAHNPNKSVEVVSPPNDGVSSLSFSPKANYLVATSWDNQVRCWEVQQSGSTVPKAAIGHEQPVLCSAWKDDGMSVFSGGCDRQAKMWPLLSGGQPQTVAMHEGPISQLAWIPEMNVLATGSWDKTIKYWDLRSSNPVASVQLPERCYAMSVKHPLMVVATADRNIIVYNLQNPQAEYKRIPSPLKLQTRCLATFPDKQGYLVGSIEGRVAVQHLDDSHASKNFTFKCHRDQNDIYAVNSINFHPVSYDWSKGAENHNPATAKNYIFLHATQDSEVKAKSRTATGSKR